jgi:predicted nucleic acid-binding protein
LIVVDASVIAPALADDDVDGARAQERLTGERLVAPELCDIEVIAVIRKALLAGVLDERRRPWRSQTSPFSISSG